jgi:D-amino-acid dehydrogenase
VPRLTPWLIRFALCSLPSRVERISIALASITLRAIDAYRPLVAGTDAENVLGNRGFLWGYVDGGKLNPNSFSLRLRARRGVTYEVLDRAGVGRINPAFERMFEAGLYFPNSVFMNDPGAFTRTLLSDFIAKGGRFEQAEVVGFEIANRRVERVRTRAGALRAGTVLLAAGPWSGGLLRRLGTNVPLDFERGYGIDMPNAHVEIERPFLMADSYVSFVPFRTGLRVGTYDELASLDAPADPKLIAKTLRSARKVYPKLNTDGATSWMRRRPSLPDSLPIIGRAPKVDNVFLNFGHGHKGLTTAAITGKLVTELMDGQPVSVDLQPFRATRFAVGG